MAKDDRPEQRIEMPPGDPEAIRLQAGAMNRVGEAIGELASVLADPGRALLMGDGQWLSLLAEIDRAGREIAELAGSGERVYGHELGRAMDKLFERKLAALAAQRRRIEELWAMARRERPNN